MLGGALLLSLPACSLPAGPDTTTLSAATAEQQAREVAEELAEVGPAEQISFRSWAVPCLDRPGEHVTVHVEATKPVPAEAVPDVKAAGELGDEVQERAHELGLAVGARGRRLELRRESGRSLQLFGSTSAPLSADVGIPIFDAMGADDDPLWRVAAQARCARVEPGADPLPTSTLELALTESQAERERALAALEPLLASTRDVPPQDCGRPNERPGAVVSALVLRPGVGLAQVEQVLDEVWPTSDGWTHNTELARLSQRLQYRRGAIVTGYEAAPGDPLQATLKVGAGCYR